MGYILSVHLRLGWLGLILLVLPAQAKSIPKALVDSVRQVQLSIKDDGVGYQPGRSRSLGMKLLHGFSRQLGGKLQITSPPGLSINLLFKEEQLVKVYA